MTPSAVTAESASLIAALSSPACYAHSVEHLDVLETHISWVILTGKHAYKIKKPVNLGFVDFTTLEARRRCCEEEIRLNRRLAPSLYEAVVKITGNVGDPRIDGDDATLEYGVRMREFPQSALASLMLSNGTLTGTHIDALAGRIAAFHGGIGIAALGSPYGAPETVIAAARDNFDTLDPLLTNETMRARLVELRAWTEREYNERLPLFTARQAEGYVRECHGDLHLGNIVILDDRLTPFDCIEFNAGLRWIDVMSEVAFLVMDLLDHGRADFAYRFLNAYLAAADGYSGINVLRFYLVYRALVRAKVHALRARLGEVADAERDRLIAASQMYVELARRCAQGAQGVPPAIILMHGLSGSGKSVLAQALAERAGAILLRSDIERKRLSDLTPLARSGSTLASGIYTTSLTLTTYNRLLDLARVSVTAGYAVIVDATFLKRQQRDLFCREAHTRRIPFIIVDVVAPDIVLHARIAARLAAKIDASEADQEVLTHQTLNSEALTATESSAVLCIDTAGTDMEDIQREACLALRTRLGLTRVPSEPWPNTLLFE